MNSQLTQTSRRLVLGAATLVVGLSAAVSAHAAAAAQVSGADYGTTGDCRAAQLGYGPAGGIPSLPARIHFSTTTVSVVNESPYTLDGQTIVRNFFLYQWMGGSSWAYTGKYTADYTRVGEASLANAGSLFSPISTVWFNGAEYSQFADPALPIPSSGLYFSNGYKVYAVGMELSWYSLNTGRLVKQYWNPQMWNLLGNDLNYNYDFRPYCDFRAVQPG